MTNTAIIPHRFQAATIEQRVADGYVNATAMCKACGKRFFDYSRIATTQAFVAALSTEAGIPVSEMIQSVKGGDVTVQGSWVHPKLAIHLAQWLSPEFAVQVSTWVFDWLQGKTVEVKAHRRRVKSSRFTEAGSGRRSHVAIPTLSAYDWSNLAMVALGELALIDAERAEAVAEELAATTLDRDFAMTAVCYMAMRERQKARIVTH